MKHRKRKHKKLIDDLIVAFGHSDRAKRRARLARHQRIEQPLRRA
jgi:hypothetical protein